MMRLPHFKYHSPRTVREAADLLISSMEKTIAQKTVTYDFERLMPGATKVKTSQFADCIVENMGAAVLV